MERNENVQLLSDWVSRTMKREKSLGPINFNIIPYSKEEIDEAIANLHNKGYDASRTDGKGNPSITGNNLMVVEHEE